MAFSLYSGLGRNKPRKSGLPWLGPLLALAACGGGTVDGPIGEPAAIHTLAYVVTECDQSGADFFFDQTLQIRQSAAVPLTVAQTPPLRSGVGGICRLFGQSRAGPISVVAGAFQRLAATPDGAGVVFEATDDFSILASHFLAPEQKGIFFVHADGSGLRRLGPASRESSFRFVLTDLASSTFYPYFSFSPDGRTFVFTDLGPGPGGEEATQIVAQDVRTGQRTEVTHLPFAVAPGPGLPAACCPTFVNDQTIAFFSYANPDGLNPEGKGLLFSVDADGSNLRAVSPIALPGSQVVPSFSITGAMQQVEILALPGTPVNPMGDALINEVFLDDGKNILQLTNFHRVDTDSAFLSSDDQQVFFTASADPVGTNPFENCQIFSIDPLGANLRQLTQFAAGAHSVSGCFPGAPPGCASLLNFDPAQNQDTLTRTLVFYSSCDPFGTNPNGGQIFAMRPDGTGLRQLTDAGGLIKQGSSVMVELPGPWAYGPHR